MTIRMQIEHSKCDNADAVAVAAAVANKLPDLVSALIIATRIWTNTSAIVADNHVTMKQRKVLISFSWCTTAQFLHYFMLDRNKMIYEWYLEWYWPHFTHQRDNGLFESARQKHSVLCKFYGMLKASLWSCFDLKVLTFFNDFWFYCQGNNFKKFTHWGVIWMGMISH